MLTNPILIPIPVKICTISLHCRLVVLKYSFFVRDGRRDRTCFRRRCKVNRHSPMKTIFGCVSWHLVEMSAASIHLIDYERPHDESFSIVDLSMVTPFTQACVCFHDTSSINFARWTPLQPSSVKLHSCLLYFITHCAVLVSILIANADNFTITPFS